MNNIVYKNSNECTWIEKYSHYDLTNKKKNYFSFCDAIFIITVKKDEVSNRQVNIMKNIKKLGCENDTFWCYTKGYKKCDLINSGALNLSYNYKIIFEFCLLKNFENILMIEDDLEVSNKLWVDYEEKKKKILNVIKENKNKCLVFHFGKFPLLSVPIKKFLGWGLNFNTHCIMFNQNSAREYLKLYESKKGNVTVDFFYNLNNKFKKYSLNQNDIFFQQSDKTSSSNLDIGYKYFIYIQSLFTGRLYYQYDPKFVKYWEPYGFTLYSFLLLFKIIILIIYVFSIVIKKLKK